VLKKRSFTIARHRTSVALEAEFWDILATVARDEHVSLAQLVAKVDAMRGSVPLARALRLRALAALRPPLDVCYK